LSNEIGIELFDEVALKFRNQILEGQVSQLKIEKDLHESRSIITGLIASLTVLILCYLLIYLWSRQKQLRQQRLLMENDKKQMEQENQVKNLTIEKMELDASLKEQAVDQLKLEVQMKEQDLIYQTLLKTDLSRVNRSVKEKLLPYQYRFSSKKDQNEFVQLLGDITREANMEPLAELEAVFNQKYQVLYDKLLARSPSLTKNELQVCALLHINLSTKDIARLLNLSASSIDMTRYRIRQKLELDQKESLTTYLIML
jgi:DNA-binding CsgD family transcriptional regulator